MIPCEVVPSGVRCKCARCTSGSRPHPLCESVATASAFTSVKGFHETFRRYRAYVLQLLLLHKRVGVHTHCQQTLEKTHLEPLLSNVNSPTQNILITMRHDSVLKGLIDHYMTNSQPTTYVYWK